MITHSNKKTAQVLSALLQQYEIRNIIISPGSRNAPLIIEFTNQKFFKNYSIIDERSAAFFGLGMAQQTNMPSVLVCTSGSALLNYYPAIAEAFYSKIPLIIVSADRPQKWIDQGEGQTIRQHNVFKNHSFYNITIEENITKQKASESIEKAIKTAIEKKGPVHINLAFDEPLYETELLEKQKIHQKKNQQNIPIISEDELKKLLEIWNQSSKKMILAGQLMPSKTIQQQLKKLSEDKNLIVLNENIANLQNSNFINNIDQVIYGMEQNELISYSPDLLITIGRNLVSKKVKYFLRKHPPKQHWHIEITDIPPNTFDALTKHINTTPEMFFSQFLFLIFDRMNKQGMYQNKWLERKKISKKRHSEFIKKIPFSDLKVFDFLEKNTPDYYRIQWGNSSSIRYAQLFDFKPNIKHFSNRGTSGIDGSSSTAIGAAYSTQKPTLLVSGDISFLYDSNALWNKYIPKNFKAIIINNGGGEIFKFIPGPSKTQALEEFFVTRHQLHLEKLAEMYGISYLYVDNINDLEKKFSNFIPNQQKPMIMEINTSGKNNHQILKDYFHFLFKTSS